MGQLEVVNSVNRDEAEELLVKVIKDGLDFKLNDTVKARELGTDAISEFTQPLPEEGVPVRDLVEIFRSEMLPYCTNFSSPNFMGFPDAGNSTAALTGAVAMNMANQNLINQSFCAPIGTLAEIAVVRWLRDAVGYENPETVNDIWDVGGVITSGGTLSNTLGIMLAREQKQPDTMVNGISDLNKTHIVVPKGIGHYSVKSAQMWLGCGHRLIEVETTDYHYDLDRLTGVIQDRCKEIMCVVAYAGDSRTMTVDNFNAIHDLVRTHSTDIWLHADACHGFSLGFSPKMRGKIAGIEKFDSITTDPHKVMATPYVISALLVREPQVMRTVTSLSDLIMQERFAFGQVTPFLGSRSWNSLKLWMMMRNAGRSGLAHMVEYRHEMAKYLESRVKSDPDFVAINDLEINSVAFLYTGGRTNFSVDQLNNINKALHTKILAEGVYHLHQFSIPDSGKIAKGETVYPLRFMSGNMNLTPDHIDQMLEYVRNLGNQIAHELYPESA